MGAPIIIRIATLFVLLLAITYFFTFYRFLFSIYKFKRDKKRNKKIASKYKEKFQTILFSQETHSSHEIIEQFNIKQTSFKKWERLMITDLILTIKSEKGTKKINQKNYSGILDAFSLFLFWQNNLRTRNLAKNKEALRKLESLGRKIPSSSLAYRIEEKNDDLRKHVKSGFIHYASYDNYKFLEDDFDDDFNPLDEMRIHVALRDRSKQKQLPLLMRWVNTAENEAYKCFLIDEIGFFKQTESCQHLLELYRETESNAVKAKIAETLGILQYTEAQADFEDSYGFVPESIQTSIIDAMGHFSTPEALIFLEHIYHQGSNTDTFIRIVENIYQIDLSKSTFLRLKADATTGFQHSVFAHIEQFSSHLRNESPKQKQNSMDANTATTATAADKIKTSDTSVAASTITSIN